MAFNETWLAQTHETAIDPDLPILDAHHHLWDSPPHRPGERYTDADYRRDAGTGHNIRASIYIECNSEYYPAGPEHLRPVGETEFVNAIAERHANSDVAVCCAIVGLADLSLGERVDEVLEAHLAAAPQRFRGIRHTNAWDAFEGLHYKHLTITPQRLLDLNYRKGFARLGRYGLSFDSWVFHPQLPEVADIARAFPDIPIIVNHLGGPLGIGPYEGKRAGIFEQWKKSVAELARCDNITMKLGGMAMHCNGFGWKHAQRPPTSDEMVAATRAYYLHAIDCFSPARCMFESNFPVDKESAPVNVVWNSFKKIAAGFSDAERADLFYRTAMRVYRIGNDAMRL